VVEGLRRAGAELDRLERLLDRLPVETLIEYVARRLGLVEGHRQMHFSLHNGGLHETRLPTGPIKNPELERLANPTAEPPRA
jgi:hypothetical protein